MFQQRLENLQALLDAFACQVLSAAPACWECYRLSRKTNKMRERIRQIPPAEWMREYDKGRFGFVRGETAASVLGYDPQSREAQELVQYMDALRSTASMTPKKLERTLKRMSGRQREQAQFMWKELLRTVDRLDGRVQTSTTECFDENSDFSIDSSVLDNPSVLFYMAIEVPCWFEFGESASVFLDKARKGDFESLKKLLNLDPYVIEDEGIRQAYWDVMLSDNKVRKKQLVEASNRKGAGKRTLKKIKIHLAAIVYARWMDTWNSVQELNESLSANFSTNPPILLDKLTYTELRRRQDEIDAQDIGGADPELPDEPRSYEQAVRRDLETLIPRR